jgi:hypothetical protein
LPGIGSKMASCPNNQLFLKAFEALLPENAAGLV